MKVIYQECGLIMLLLFKALDEVQGKYIGKYELLREEGKNVNLSLKNLGAQHNLFFRIMKEKDLLKYTKDMQLPSATLGDSKEIIFKALDSPRKSMASETSRQKHMKINSLEDRFKKAKTFDDNIFKTTKILNQQFKENENYNFDSSIPRNYRVQKLYCRQITRSEPNSRNNIFENVEHICAPLTPDNITAQIYNPKEKQFVNTVTTTATDLNCRRIMNSILNEMGEIVDTVTQVCDTPPTTTTTTTTTTPRPTTTTAKPLIKICQTVMDSHLNEKGEIIDSVNIVCKMQQATT